MITFLKTWVNQIIIAVIIATIIEMILPNMNNKKYIKMVIGLYVLFTIIQPIITKFTGNNLDILNFNYKKYFDKDILETSTENFEDNNSKLIKQTYIDNIKSDIEIKLKNKGYKIVNLNINIIDDESLDVLGTIKNIVLKIEKLEDNEEKDSKNIIKVENVEINNSINNTNNKVEKSNISEKQKKEIINFLSNEYSIDKGSIVIN